MNKKPSIALLFISLVLFTSAQTLAQDHIFARLDGSPLNTAGWDLRGMARAASITDTSRSELLLCTGKWSSGAAFYRQPVNLSHCNKWIAEFDFRLFDGKLGDGFAFCFLDKPPSRFSQVGDFGIPVDAHGLEVCFDDWNHDIPLFPSTAHRLMPRIEIRLTGDDCTDLVKPEFIMHKIKPTRFSTYRSVSFLRPTEYSHAKITYNDGYIEVYVNGILYLSTTRQFNFAGWLGFTGGTGEYTDEHSIKNAVIYTDMPPSYAGENRHFCPYDTIQLGGQADPLCSYSWSPSANLNDSSSSAPLLHLANDSSDSQFLTYYVNTSYKDNPGCASRDSVTIEVFPVPIVNFITPEVCPRNVLVQFFDDSYTRDSSSLPFSYEWHFDDPYAKIGNRDSSSLKDPFHYFSALIDYQLTLVVTNSKGCTAWASKKFSVNGAEPGVSSDGGNIWGLYNMIKGSASVASTVHFHSDTRQQSTNNVQRSTTNVKRSSNNVQRSMTKRSKISSPANGIQFSSPRVSLPKTPKFKKFK
jgi:hypothetical protein